MKVDPAKYIPPPKNWISTPVPRVHASMHHIAAIFRPNFTLNVFPLACKDEHGEAFAASSIFLTHKESDCRRCNCKDQGGILTAKCFKVHCPHLNCPLPFQEKSENGCCKTCSSGWGESNLLLTKSISNVISRAERKQKHAS